MAYHLLLKHGDLKDGNYHPNKKWRETCSVILGKDVRMINVAKIL